MLITQISPQKRNNKRMNVFIDGEFSFSLDKELIIILKLKENQTLTKEQVNEILKENELDKWYGRSLRFLSFRPRSEKEIMDYLNKNEVGKTLTHTILEKLKRYKLINDEEFTRWLVEQRQGRNARGKRIITQELKRKGVDKEIISDAFTENTATLEFDNAERIAATKLKSLRNQPSGKTRDKLAGFLLRRGFSWDIVNRVLKKLKYSEENILD